MKLQVQLTNLELSKKLFEAGVPQTGIYAWTKHPEMGDFSIIDMNYPQGYTNLLGAGYEVYSAFSVAELGVIKLTSHVTRKDEAMAQYVKDGIIYQKFADTEANARAKCLLFILEKKLLMIKDLRK